jgi:hypothetical protein
MKNLFDILFGEDIYEVLAKAGFAGSVVGAIGLKDVKIAERIFHIVVGFFTAIFLVPLLMDVVNFAIIKYWGVGFTASPAIIAGIGFLVGRLGIVGLEGLWIGLKLSSFIRKLLLTFLKK